MPSNKELAKRVWKKRIPENKQNSMHKFLVKICEEAGPREAGSVAEAKAASIVKEEFEKHCDTVRTEKFKLAPKAFLSFTIISPVLFLAGVPFYWIYPLVTVIMTILAMFIFYMQFLRYAEFVDVFFPKKTSQNVIGEIEPKEKWKQTLMFSAHIDSAYQFNFNLYMPRSFNYFLIGLPILLVAFTLTAASYYVLHWFLFVSETVFVYLGIGLAAITIPLAVMLFFFKTNWAVMGANDNLSGIAILKGIGETISRKPENRPLHTKILLVAFGSEEAGLRGSKRWIKKHTTTLAERPFYFMNFDGVAKSNDIHLVHREKTLGVTYDPEIVADVIKTAKKIGFTLPCRPLPFGATDGSAIAQGGFDKGVSIEAMDIEKPEKKKWYHTINDTADVVEPEALELVRQLAIEFARTIDSKQQKIQKQP